jgi:ribosomal protein S18 acetylase RimI-like enzyme
MNIDILPLNLDSAHLEAAVEVYHEYTPGELSYQTQFFTSHMERLGYIGFVAQVEDKVIGVTFGSRSLAGQWWHEHVAAHVGTEHPALQDAWILTQLNVFEAYRNQGIGKLLHDKILAAQPCPRLLLSTPVANKAAQRFYERYDWEFLHNGIEFFAGDEPYAIMRKELKG